MTAVYRSPDGAALWVDRGPDADDPRYASVDIARMRTVYAHTIDDALIGGVPEGFVRLVPLDATDFRAVLSPESPNDLRAVANFLVALTATHGSTSQAAAPAAALWSAIQVRGVADAVSLDALRARKIDAITSVVMNDRSGNPQTVAAAALSAIEAVEDQQ